MKNEKLINELKAVGFENATPLMLTKEIRTGYSVIVEFYEGDESLMIANGYYKEKQLSDWDIYPLFRGFIESKDFMVKLVTVLNLEFEGKEAFYSLIDF